MARPAALVTTASRLKAIVGRVERTHGTQAKEELLAELSLSAEALADETRPLALPTYLAALDWLASREGEEAVLDLADDLLHDENLGVFAPLIRAHERLEDALDHVHRFTRFRGLPPVETLSVERGRCRLRFRSLAIEKEKLLRLGHAAELAAICRLYGFDETRVRLGDDGTLTLRWRRRHRERLALLALLPSPAFFAISFRTGLLVTIGVLAALAFVHRERAHRIESRAQRHRIRVLERGLSLSRGLAKGSTEGELFADAYRLGPLLGIGANGAVHRAVRIADGAAVAIKLLRHAAAHDELATDRLRREAEALALSRHPNVVELYDHGVEGGIAYLVLELLHDGEPLAELLAREGPLTPETLLPLALGICDALVAMHAAGVIHRDLKPSNVFVGSREGEPFLKLIDFGLAHIEWAETRLTEPGRPIGTPGYRAPEQAEGRAADARSDIYAFGVLLRECLTGQRPDEPEVPSVARRSSGIERTAHPLPPGFRELIEQATSPDPADRFPDARSLRRALLSIELREARSATAPIPQPLPPRRGKGSP